MPDPLYLLMMEIAKSDPPTTQNPRMWMPAMINGERMVPREIAEQAAQQASPCPRFLMLAGDTDGTLTEAGRSFGGDSMRPLATLPGETIWHYGEPTGTDLLAVLRDAWTSHGLDALPSPDPHTFPIPAAEAIELARDRFGAAERDEIDAAFVAMLSTIGGGKHSAPLAPDAADGLPPPTLTVYLVPLTLIGG